MASHRVYILQKKVKGKADGGAIRLSNSPDESLFSPVYLSCVLILVSDLCLTASYFINFTVWASFPDFILFIIFRATCYFIELEIKFWT